MFISKIFNFLNDNDDNDIILVVMVMEKPVVNWLTTVSVNVVVNLVAHAHNIQPLSVSTSDKNCFSTYITLCRLVPSTYLRNYN